MDKITMIKPGILEMSIGTGIVKSVQELAVYLVKDISTEEMEEYKKLFNRTLPDEFPKEWMKHIFNVTVLLKMFQDTAKGQGLTYEKEIRPDMTSLDDLLSPE